MSDPVEGGGAGESDVLKIYVYGMLAVTVVCFGVVWFVQKRTEDTQKQVASARRAMPTMAQGKRDVQALFSVFEKNQEDLARTQGLKFFTDIFRRKGINDAAIQLGAWKSPPADGPDGQCLEERYDIKFSNRSPLTRKQIAEFLHEIERSSTRLRVLELSIQRNGKEDEQENDAWTGNCLIGYRRPKIKDSAN
jgi:hypothetical protein